MTKKTLVALGALLSTYCSAFDYGLSTSGSDISIGLLGGGKSGVGVYGTFLADFDEYQNGDLVTVCSDGKISGSTGSGTCSGHGGASKQREANFSRFAFSLGATYLLHERVRLNGGLILGMYSSDIDIGEMTDLDYTNVGVDAGLSFKVLTEEDMWLSISHETDAGKTLIGFWLPFGKTSKTRKQSVNASSDSYIEPFTVGKY